MFFAALAPGGEEGPEGSRRGGGMNSARFTSNGISGLVVEYMVAIDVTRVRFPADAFV